MENIKFINAQHAKQIYHFKVYCVFLILLWIWWQLCAFVG